MTDAEPLRKHLCRSRAHIIHAAQTFVFGHDMRLEVRIVFTHRPEVYVVNARYAGHGLDCSAYFGN
jgi:hypothetical protein